MRYGGATTSVLVENGAGARIVIDAGTGLRTLQPFLTPTETDAPVLMLFTHYHLDHLIGLPAFVPLYNPLWQVTFASPQREGLSAGNVLERLMDKPFWPAPFRARQRFVVLPNTSDGEPLRHGPFEVRWCAVHHSNGCHAYRIDEPASGASVVFATDLEWGASSGTEREALMRLCRTPRPAGVLIMDGQYDAAEAERFRGWGHSTWQETLQVAAAAGVGRLVVTHHAPDSDDATLDRRELMLSASEMNACLAHEGMKLEEGKEP